LIPSDHQKNRQEDLEVLAMATALVKAEALGRVADLVKAILDKVDALVKVEFLEKVEDWFVEQLLSVFPQKQHRFQEFQRYQLFFYLFSSLFFLPVNRRKCQTSEYSRNP